MDTGSSGGGGEKGASLTEWRVQRGGLDCEGPIRLWTLVWSSEQWEVPEYLEAGQHRDNMGVGGGIKVFSMVWKRS